MPRPITDKDVGLKVLRDTAVEDREADLKDVIDIVAVHGMGAHPDDTWCKAVNCDGEDKSYVNWLQEPSMLPAVIPNARIMRYGYHSQWFGQDSVQTKASIISQRLLLLLRRNRKECLERPLIFIAHSFGGLVVLRTLVDAKHEEDKWPGIYNSAVGLVFFGTPFRGAHDTLSHGDILQLAQERFGSEHVNGENLRILRARDESLQDLVDMYLRTARQSAMPKIACFFEQKVTDVGAILGKEPGKVVRNVVLVDETSGCLDLNASSDKYSLPRTHFDMNKFGSPDEDDFLTLGEILDEMVRQGPRLIAKRTRRPKEISKSRPGIKPKLFYTLDLRPRNTCSGMKSYWHHLTLESYHVYEKIYDDCKSSDSKINFQSFLQQFNPSSTPSRATIEEAWTGLLRKKCDVRSSIHPKSLVMAVLYMLHMELCLDIPKPRLANGVVGVNRDRREALKRFAKWVPCQCDQACGREWNFVNEIGLCRGGEGRECAVAKLFERASWQTFFASKAMRWLDETRRLWENAEISS